MNTRGQPSRTRADTPGLQADVLYLRPFERCELLASLASLGVFVSEYQGEPRHATRDPDISIVVARGAADRGVVARLALEAPVLVVVVPTSESTQVMMEAGASLCVHDAELRSAPRTALLMAARLARQARTAVHWPIPPVGGSVRLGDVVFSAESCSLRGSTVTLSLSRAERDVLTRLAAVPGVPVRAELLADAAQIRPFPASRYLASVILRIRRKLEQAGASATTLTTVRGVGYVLWGANGAAAEPPS